MLFLNVFAGNGGRSTGSNLDGGNPRATRADRERDANFRQGNADALSALRQMGRDENRRTRSGGGATRMQRNANRRNRG